MADTTTELTIDQAMDLYDDGGQVAPYRQNEPDRYDPGTLDEGRHPPERSSGLTLDEAASIPLAGDSLDRSKRIPDPSMAVAIVDGQPASLHDLVQGYGNWRFHQSRLSEQYEAIQEVARNIVSNGWELAGLLSQVFPAQPDIALVNIDANEYARQKALFDEGQERIAQVLHYAASARNACDHLAVNLHEQKLRNENVLLVQHFPETAEPEGREAFFDYVREVAYECGFSEAEMQAVADHRMFRLAHLAAKGLEASKAEPARKRRRRRNRDHRQSDAMERLERTGSFEDAMAVDFD